MASAISLLSEDQFLCSICLDVFTDPVTIPCGHNFCKSCITEHWDTNDQHQCPLCKEQYEKIPHLRVNTFISEMAAQFKQSVSRETITSTIRSSSEEQHTDPGEVLCDFCTDTKLRALKSCLDCLVSYCEAHLEPHHRIPGLKRHMLINPVKNLESRVCKKHNRPLEQFCRTDQICVCQFCSESEHKLHHIVSLKEEYEEKKAELGKTEAEVQRMIQERELKIKQIKQSVTLSREDADRETAKSVEVFTALMQSVERRMAQVIDMIDEKHKQTEELAEGLIKELEEEISELMKRSTELEQLSRSEDHFQFLQNNFTLKVPPPTKHWTKVKIPFSYDGILGTPLAELEETLSREMKVLCAEAELKKYRQYSVDVTLDPETAHPKLILSADGKQVYHGNTSQYIRDSPKRISSYFGVLGKQSFSSGRFYFEVQVKDKTDWVLGVASESIHRTGSFLEFWPQNGFWTISLKDGYEYKALVNFGPIYLSLKSKPQKVGVFVDYEAGLVSFYDVDAPALIYAFTDCYFAKKIYPILNPRNNNAGTNSTPLIISPVTRTD
ncbi:E3 ubiquitin-protein ligase TRIM39-like [Xyrichtys novacula]|uniref:E3 ubiquitin-protein ligase TRIM39-like n=1 Tax=Xyrichtys novacula TaxID=13765 RepID=A0AAV1F3L9_XYRNO|nr:E3 ubiquitin-protein ligase TRIM39-like [Xyrichtys novacula]